MGCRDCLQIGVCAVGDIRKSLLAPFCLGAELGGELKLLCIKACLLRMLVVAGEVDWPSGPEGIPAVSPFYSTPVKIIYDFFPYISKSIKY